MDTRIGLDYIVENGEYVIKLGAALDTNNVTVKKQVFELLSALSAYSSDGHNRALETLDHYKNLKGTRYRLKIVASELDAPNIPLEYQVALLAFVNCLINATQKLHDRIRIRNEFIGLKILPILSNIRRVSGCNASVAVQLDVFDENRECDDAQSLQGPSDINLNSHLDVFYTILGQVADTPQEIPFLSILQHLLRIDPKEAISDIIWDTTEKLVHRSTLLENREDSTRLLRTPSVQKFTCTQCSPNRKQSIAPLIPTIPNVPIVAITQANTELADTNSKVPKPPPPPPPMSNLSSMSNPSCSAPAPPPPALPKTHRPKTPEIVDLGKLPQQETPVPKSKMKTINWNKIPSNKLMGKNNIWTMVASSHQNSPMAEMDWNEMEGLFCQQATSTQNSPKMGGRDSASSSIDTPGTSTEPRKSRKENAEITLLDGKRSLNINIFLKQFRTSNEEIIQLIKDGEHEDIGSEKLRGLLKILPEIDELDMLKTFDGDKVRLGNAEKFLMQLSQVPNYKLRVESMLLKEEFVANLSYLEPSINAILFAGDELMNNVHLREVLYMVVVAGNFLNAGGYAGNAAGVKLASLQKLTDIRANKPGMNLIHFVALQAEKRNPNLLVFAENLITLENASKTTAEQITNEINTLDARIIKIKRQIEMPATEADLKCQMSEFLLSADTKLAMLKNSMKHVEILRLQLSEFFCEDPSSFRLEECFKIFQTFCEKFRQAVQENERRRLQEEQATIRRKMREEQLARRARHSQAGTPVSDSDNSLMFDSSQLDIRASPAMARRRIGSFNSGAGEHHSRDEGFSPDITPTGSLRRRRSRVLSEEDDNSLMDFLRSSANENSLRERKTSSYGSLDRSWARRARTGSNSKKRPELLNIDFSLERERPVSPANLEDARPRRISREWRQKIESWLQANEQDEKQSEEYKRRARRLTGNRRSFENDSENERSKLDPLPEERAAISSSSTQPTTTATATTPSNEPYKRVYSDWRPSVSNERTDPSLDETEPSKSLADDNATIKSDKLRNSTSSTSIPSLATPLQSIIEEDRRNNENIVKINIPSEYEPVYQKHNNQKHNASGLPNESASFHVRPMPKAESPVSRTGHSFDHDSELAGNKIEIDSDNIETPPVARRNIASLDDKSTMNSFNSKKLQTPRPLHQRTIDEAHAKDAAENHPNDGESLGNGHFDRHSSARRTRRYRRPTDHSSGNDERQDTTPESISPTNQMYPVSSNKYTVDPDTKSKSSKSNAMDTDEPSDPTSKSKPIDILSRIGRHGRNMSSINQEAVREAIRKLKSPTETPERIWSPPRDVLATPKALAAKVATNHELNDEGFEETQSLVSDTPSHGKESSSSCNEPADSKHQTISVAPSRRTASAAISNGTKAKSSVKSLLERNRESLARSRSLRAATTNLASTNTRNTVTPNRTNSLRVRAIDNGSNNNRSMDVERSGSRTSLRSSRSSLNSSASTNTVRNMAIKTMPNTPANRHLSNASTADKNSGRKKLSQSSGLSGGQKSIGNGNYAYLRAPASRSSSSGSSIGASSRQTKTTSSSNSATPPISPQRPAFRTAVSSNSILNQPQPTLRSTSKIPNVKGIASKTSNRMSSFMRPTTSSATKITRSK